LKHHAHADVSVQIAQDPSGTSAIFLRCEDCGAIEAISVPTPKDGWAWLRGRPEFTGEQDMPVQWHTRGLV
jgi:hypothetical protein